MEATDLGLLAQYGLLGVMFALLLFGQVFPKHVVEEKNRRIEKLEAKVETYETTMQERILPALIKSTEVLAKMANGVPK